MGQHGNCLVRYCCFVEPQLLPESDVLATFAERAEALDLAEPELTDEPELTIHQGRHLVVEQLAPATLNVRGRDVPAIRYRVVAEKMDLTVWYSNDNRWLALESVAKGGNVIRYELS